jgi:hypothetical protein
MNWRKYIGYYGPLTTMCSVKTSVTTENAEIALQTSKDVGLQINGEREMKQDLNVMYSHQNTGENRDIRTTNK